MLIVIFFSGMKCLHLWRERVNTKKHFPKDRGNFIPGRVSSRDVISCVNNLLESSTYWKMRKPDFSFHKGVFQKQPPRGVPEKRCIFSEHFFLRTSLCGCFWVFLNLSMELFSETVHGRHSAKYHYKQENFLELFSQYNTNWKFNIQRSKLAKLTFLKKSSKTYGSLCTGWPTKMFLFLFGNNFYKNKKTFKIFSPQILEVYRILLVETTLESIMFY